MSVNVWDFHEEGEREWEPAIQRAIDSLVDSSPSWIDKSGGTVEFPPGEYRVGDQPIDIPCGNIHLKASGGPWPHLKSTWIRKTGAGPLFRFPYSDKRINGFKISDMVLYGNKNTGVAFEIYDGSTFCRDFLFERLGAMRFSAVIEAKTKPGGKRRIGNVKIRDCAWSANRQAVVAEECWINMLTVRDSEIRQNKPPAGKAVFQLHRPYRVLFDGNCLEGQSPVLIADDGDSFTFTQNYFEGHAADIFQLTNIDNIDFGCNFYRVLGDKGGVGKFRFADCDNVRWFGKREQFRFDDCTNVTPNPTMR